jgi:hypothetical protein
MATKFYLPDGTATGLIAITLRALGGLHQLPDAPRGMEPSSRAIVWRWQFIIVALGSDDLAVGVGTSNVVALGLRVQVACCTGIGTPLPWSLELTATLPRTDQAID